MKKIIYLILITISLIGCSKNELNNNSSSRKKQRISLLADGVLYSVTSGGAGVEEADAHIDDGRFQLDATTATKDFSINLNSGVDIGTHTIAKGTGTASRFAQWEDGDLLFSALGSAKSHFRLTITNKVQVVMDNYYQVEGTFSGVLYNYLGTDSVVISNGQITIVD